MGHAKGFVWVGVVALGLLAFSSLGALGGPTYGQAISKQKQGDWAGGIEAYLAVIQDLLATHPDSMILPKSYVGCAYCALKLGNGSLAFQCLTDMWTTGAWSNPNLPSSPEFEGYRAMLDGRYGDAIGCLGRLVESQQPGTKRWQEAMIGLSLCHSMTGEIHHLWLSRKLLSELSEGVGDKKLVAFARWLNGVNHLAIGDSKQAQTWFASATEGDATFNPGETAVEVITDQLQPPASVSSALADTGKELGQLLENYVSAWGLTLEARKAEEAGNIGEALILYGQAHSLWQEQDVSSTGFPASTY